MKELPIRRVLNEDTRKECVMINGNVYSLHITDSEVIVTDNEDYTKIYSIQSKEMYSQFEKQSMLDDCIETKRERLKINPPKIKSYALVFKNNSPELHIKWSRGKEKDCSGEWIASLLKNNEIHINSDGFDSEDDKCYSEAILREILKNAVIDN